MSAHARMAAALALLAFGCGDDETDEAPLPVAIQFAARIHGEDFVCMKEYLEVGEPPAPFTLTDARFYVHDVKLVDDSGRAHTVELDDAPFQGNGIALLDFEDGCGPDGTAETNTTITGVVDAGVYRALEFTLGVPPERNFIDLASAEPPLDETGMFWTWQSGYKYLKIDGFTPSDDGGIHPFLLHVGAIGCPGENPQAPPTGACDSPNRVRYRLDGFELDRTTVVARIADVFAESDLSSNTAGTAPGCMSEAKDPECSVLLPRLGVDDATEQQLFVLD